MELVGTSAAFIAVFFWVITGAISKKIVRGLGSVAVAAIMVLASIISMIAAGLFFGFQPLQPVYMAEAAVSGIFLALGFIFNYMSLKTEQLSSVAALGELNAALLVLFALLGLGEAVTSSEVIAMIAIFAGAALIVFQAQFRINRGLIPVFLAQISWTIWWIIVSYPITASGNLGTPMLIARLAGGATVVAFLLASKGALSGFRSAGGGIWRNKAVMALLLLAVVSGICDGFGDFSFSVTIGGHVLAIGSAIIALNPMVTVLLAFILYKEKMSRIQLLGVASMVVGALALALL